MTTVVGKITVLISDDPRYTTGGQYDVVLAGASLPAPADLVQGSLDSDGALEAAAEAVSTNPAPDVPAQ